LLAGMENDIENTQPKKSKDKKTAKGGRQTLFRVTYRTQINLIRIADSKANMILGINTTIMAVLVGIISSKVIFTGQDAIVNFELVIPVISMVLTALVSAIYAIRSAKPRLIRPEHYDDPRLVGKKSFLFFENIHIMHLDEYIDTMENLIKSSKDVYENMIIDIYNQSKVLHMKYRLLRASYIILTYGLIFSILLFLVLWLFIRKPII
jgi:hypothetical protein